VDLTVAYLTALATSIPIARMIGPERLGYFTYMVFLTRMSARLGTLGATTTVRKYMAEYLGKGDPQTARAIFYLALRFQLAVSAVVTAVALVLVFTVSDPAYRMVSGVLVLSILPYTLHGIPSHANMANENMSANIPGSLAGNFLYMGLVGVSLVVGWDLLGVACAQLLAAVTELVVKMIAVRRWLDRAPRIALPADLRRRLLAFSGDGLVLMLLQLVVWDRSDVFLLERLASSRSELSFYGTAISLTDQVSQIPLAVAGGIGMTLMAEYGRDIDAMRRIASQAMRYLALLACPLLFGLAALSDPLIRVLYGWEYLPAIPVLALAGPLAVGKALMSPAQQVLLSTERQRFLIGWLACCGAMNVLLDVLCIPGYGALGAAWAHGTAQTVAVFGMWTYLVRKLGVEMDYPTLRRALVASLVMAAAVVPLAWLPLSWTALIAGPVVGAAVYALGLRLTGALGRQDRQRLLQLRPVMPGFLRSPLERFVNLLAPDAGPLPERTS
jgi:O-antigen/teichoic acid export membrane protein